MTTYTIRPGDTLSGLAKKFGTSVKALASLNRIADPNRIIAGHTLQLPDEFSRGLGRSLLRPEGTKRAPAKAPPAKAAPKTPAQPAPKPAKSTPAPKAAAVSAAVPKGTEAQYAHFKGLIESHGGQFRSGANQVNLVGFRKPTNTHENHGAGRYDDRLAMVWKDAQGKPHVKLFTYNTEPASNMSRFSNDVNGDGRADQGRVPGGYHEYALSTWKHGFCLRATGDFRVERDMNHDGTFSEHRVSGGGASMLFHQGGVNGTGSAGCQTFAPAEWARFQAEVRRARGTIGYTLINT